MHVDSLPVAVSVPPVITVTLTATFSASVEAIGLVDSLSTAAVPVPSPSFGDEAALSIFIVAAETKKSFQTNSFLLHRNIYNILSFKQRGGYQMF